MMLVGEFECCSVHKLNRDLESQEIITDEQRKSNAKRSKKQLKKLE
jgi:hypothetical protein